MIAFVCASPVQIMRAIHMKMRYRICKEKADIYILHKCPGYMDYANNLKKENIFENVFATDVSKLGKRIVFKLLFGNNEYAKLIRKHRYTKLFTFNIEDELAQAIFCVNKNIPGFEHHCIEDGPNIYKLYEPPKYKWYHPYKLMGIDKQVFHIKKWWTSCPEFIEIPKSFHTQKEQLKIIDSHDQEYINIVNTVFDYRPSVNLENADLLIMDESHYSDGLMIDNADYKLYKKIKNKYSKLNILVKIHPRTRDNRYLSEFNVMESTNIPWELYILNRENKISKDLIQMSIVCGTMVSDRFMFGVEGKKIILGPMFYDKIKIPAHGVPRVSQNETDNYEKIKKIYKNPNHFIIAYSEDDLYNALNYMIAEIVEDNHK